MRAAFLLIGAGTVVAGASANLVTLVSDLSDNAQAVAARPGTQELWVANKATSSMTAYTVQPGNAAKSPAVVSSRVGADSHRSHYMAEVSSFAFDASGETFATCQDNNNDRLNKMNPGDGFMGPSLWNTSTYAKANQDNALWATEGGKTYYGSHIDMSHASPYCTGITNAMQTTRDDAAWGRHVYYALDANPQVSTFVGSLMRYDFGKHHGEGNNDHADASMVRLGVRLQRPSNKDIPSHIAYLGFEPPSDGLLGTTRPSSPVNDRGVLLVSDTAGGKLLAVDLLSGRRRRSLQPMERVHSYDHYDVDTPAVLLDDTSLPSGLAVDREYLSRLPECARAKEEQAAANAGTTGTTTAPLVALVWSASYDTGTVTALRVVVETETALQPGQARVRAQVVGTLDTGLKGLTGLAVDDDGSLLIVTGRRPGVSTGALSIQADPLRIAAPALFECDQGDQAPAKSGKKKTNGQNKTGKKAKKNKKKGKLKGSNRKKRGSRG